MKPDSGQHTRFIRSQENRQHARIPDSFSVMRIDKTMDKRHTSDSLGVPRSCKDSYAAYLTHKE